MQNKGLIRFFAIALALVCLYQLSFTFVARKVERDALKYAQSERYVNLAREMSQGNELLFTFLRDSVAKSRERFYLDSIMNLTVYNLGFASYTFQQVKERELNLGLDLKGGMNVTLEVSVPEILRVLSHYNSDPVFLQALDRAREMQRVSREEFVTLFGMAFQEVDPNASLAAIFSTVELRDRINFNSTNEEVLNVLRTEVNGAIDRSFQILRTRIDRFGVAQPNIQMLEGTGRILVELPGIKEPERVRRLLQGTARLEFWETYEFTEVYQYFIDANERLRVAAIPTEAATAATAANVPAAQLPEPDPAIEELLAQTDTAQATELVDIIAPDTAALTEDNQQFIRENPLFAILVPAFVQNQAGQMVPG